MDRYPDYRTLSANETQGQDFRVRVRNIGAGVTVIAPHGGRIEPRTSGIAEAIAGRDFNLYSFEGIKDRNNKSLHITSHRFDEPRALRLAAASATVITVHACKDPGVRIYVGGRRRPLVLALKDALESEGITTHSKESLAGIHPENICNRGLTGEGVQLEFSRGIRETEGLLEAAISIIRTALLRHLT